MSGDYTRRTHIVRIPDPANTSQDASSGNYVDIEVLDAVAFRIENNKEVVLQLTATDGSPYIVDKTGGGHDKSPDKPTSLSHMNRVKSSDGKNALDVEVIDCWAARDQNDDEWILDMQPGSDGSTAYNISDGTGDSQSTRREHNEIVTNPPGKTKAAANGQYLTSVRSDNIAFRKQNDWEVILSCPSCDDPNAQGVDFGRASTFMTPSGYDPNDTSTAAVKPPSLAQSGDKRNYVNFVQNPDGTTQPILTQDAKIDMGPFWWIRKINVSGDWLGLYFLGQATDTAMNSWQDNAFFASNAGNPAAAPDLSATYTEGNPGNFVYTGGAGARNIGTQLFNYTLTAADLASKITVGNKSITGFGLAFQNSNVLVGVLYMLNIAQLGADGTTLNIEIDTAAEQPYNVELFTYKKSDIVAGLQVGDFLLGMSQDGVNLPGGSNWRLSVDTSTLQFTIPPGGASDLGLGPYTPPT